MNKWTNIQLCNFSGYANCKSMFLCAKSTLYDKCISLSRGINVLYGDFDCGIWATCYAAVMPLGNGFFRHRQDVIYTDRPTIMVDGEPVSSKFLADISCYLDSCFPLFKKKRSVNASIQIGLQKCDSEISFVEICQLFDIQKERESRYVTQVGNDLFRCMAAIGVAWNKEVFFFPWTSEAKVQYYGRQLTDVLEILSKLNKVVVIPTNSLLLRDRYF